MDEPEISSARLAELAGHESAHCVAAFLLGRLIASVSIERNEDSGGRAHIWTLRQPQTHEEALIDITVFLAGDVFCGWQGMALEWAETGVAEQDEARAYNSASKIPGVATSGVKAIVELGRARAHALIEREEFKAGHAALCPVLLERQTLGGEEVEVLLTAAIGKPSAVADQPDGEVDELLAGAAGSGA